MVNNNFIEKLLDGAKVEWKTLGNVATILNGYAFKSREYVNNGIRVIRISDVQKGRISNATLKFYPIEMKKTLNNYLLKENDLVMSLTGNVGRVAMLSKSDLPAGLNQRVACMRVNNKIVLTRYLFHFFDQNFFENEAMRNATGGGQKNMSTSWLSKYEIPIPPMHVQKEIVRILDTFTELKAELKAELTARKKQYIYYREQLLTFADGEVEWKVLGDVVDFKRGKTITAKTKINGDIPVISGGRKPAYYNAKYNRENKTITVAGSGAYAGHIMYWDEKIFVSDAFSIKPHLNILDTKYLYYFLLDKQNWIYSLKKGSGVPHVYFKDLAVLKIPIPPLHVQEEVVNILDKFDTITTSIQSGLPKEIEQRKKQYEYYRNLLLTFPKQVKNK